MPSATLAVAPLTTEAARDLTDRIRSTAENLCDLLSEAYEGQAHRALGFASWEAYVGAEFGMSRTYSYRLLTQARVIEQLEEASGVSSLSPIGDIPELAAREIAPHLPSVVESVRERVEAGQEPREAVREAVADARSARNGRHAEAPALESSPTEPDDTFDVTAELEAAASEIDRLTALVESLQKTDTGREIASLHARYAALNGRLQQEMTTCGESRRQATYQEGVLKKVRNALGVEKNADILPAIEALKAN